MHLCIALAAAECDLSALSAKVAKVSARSLASLQFTLLRMWRAVALGGKGRELDVNRDATACKVPVEQGGSCLKTTQNHVYVMHRKISKSQSETL